MDYVSHLNPAEQQVHALVVRVAHVAEDTPICYQQSIYGNFQTRGMLMSLCVGTSRASEPSSLRQRVNETFLHEAVHVAQACKGYRRYLVALGVKRSEMALSPIKRDSLKRIVATDSRLAAIDHEALYFDNKPGIVKSMIQKYCF